MDSEDQKFLVNMVRSASFTDEQASKTWDLFPEELKLFIKVALEKKVGFVISGSFASYSVGCLDQHTDFDVYINGTLECLEAEFYPFGNRLQMDRQILRDTMNELTEV